jgi:hypothetical protein
LDSAPLKEFIQVVDFKTIENEEVRQEAVNRFFSRNSLAKRFEVWIGVS